MNASADCEPNFKLIKMGSSSTHAATLMQFKCRHC